jgi:hypothetical protein
MIVNQPMKKVAILVINIAKKQAFATDYIKQHSQKNKLTLKQIIPFFGPSLYTSHYR